MIHLMHEQHHQIELRLAARSRRWADFKSMVKDFEPKSQELHVLKRHMKHLVDNIPTQPSLYTAVHAPKPCPCIKDTPCKVHLNF